MKQLSGLDASFLYFETSNAPMHIGGLAIYDPSGMPAGGFDWSGMLDFTRHRLPKARSFRQRIVRVPFNLDHPYWLEDGDFDLEFHMRHMALPQPGDWSQLWAQTARLHSRPLDTTRPLWEMYVIEGLNGIPGLPEGSFAVVSKVHHAAVDGVSGAEITAALHDLEQAPGDPHRADEWAPERLPSDLELVNRAYLNNFMQPMRWAEVASRSLPVFARVGLGLSRRELTAPAAPGRVPKTRFNKTVSPHRAVVGRSFSLDTVREIKSSVTGATVNDVILTICGGALRKYLESKNELPDEPLIAMAPISVRGEGEKGAMGNRVSAMSVGLASDIEGPLARLRAVHEGTVASKELTNAVGARLMTDYSQFIPAATAGLAARLYTRLGVANRMSPIFNCVVTNVPGPQVPLYSNGARLVTQFGLGPILDGMGLIMPVFSYCGQITVSATSCRTMMPDHEYFGECLQESFDELGSETLPRTRRPSSKAKRAAPAKKAPKKAKSPMKRGKAKAGSTSSARSKRSAPRKKTPD